MAQTHKSIDRRKAAQDRDSVARRLAAAQGQNKSAPAASVGTTAQNSSRGSYYSPRQYGADAGQYEARITQTRAAMEERTPALREQQRAMETARAEAEAKRERWETIQGKLRGENAAELYQRVDSERSEAVMRYREQMEAYQAMYQEYLPYETAHNDAVKAYNGYMTAEREEQARWKSTIRPAETIRAEQRTLAGSRAELKRLMMQSNDIAEGRAAPDIQAQAAQIEQRIRELQAYLGGVGDREKLLSEELEWSNHFLYEDLRQNADFAEKSKYQTTYNSDLAAVAGLANASAYGDATYDYINRDRRAQAEVAGMDPLGDMQHLTAMTDDEIAMYNYVYSTQGADAARGYLNYIRPNLTARHTGAAQDAAAELAQSGWGAAVGSALSVPMALYGGLRSGVAQVGSFITGEGLDPNANYNMASNLSGGIRQEVAAGIEEALGETWGPVGSYAYQLGMNAADVIADALVGKSLFGAGTKAAGIAAKTLMGSRAISGMVTEGKNRGLSDTQAMTLGVVNLLAELLGEKLGEKYGLDALLKLPEGWETAGFWKGAGKGALGEAGEEALSNIINLAADIAVAGEESEFAQNIERHKAEGKDNGAAALAALGDAGAELFLDALGGGITGGVFGGVQGYRGKKAAEAEKKAGAAESAAGTVSEMETVEDAVDKASGASDQTSNQTSNANGVVDSKMEKTTPVAGGVKEGLTTAGESSVAEATGKQEATVAKNATTGEDVPDRNVGETVIENGGTTNGTEQAGTDLSDGDEERGTGSGAPEPTYGLDDTPEGRLQRRQQQAQTARRRAAFAHNAAQLGQVRRVSARELGVQDGTEWQELVEIPRNQWDSEMLTVARRCETATGRKIRFVDNPICIRDSKGGQHYTAGCVDGDQIVMNASHSRWTVEQIADHEEYHAKAEMFARSGLNEQLRQRIVETVGEDQLQDTIKAYTDRLDWMTDIPEDISDEELDRLAAKAEAEVLEEMLADAYAGINRFEGHAERFEAAVNDFMNEHFIGKEHRNEAATMPDAVDPVRTDTGQTKYLADDGGGDTVKQQIAEKQDTLNAMDPVASISVPSNFGRLDKSGKQNWIIEKLRPTGYQVDRSGFGVIEFAKKRLKSAFNYFRKGSAEEAVFEALPHVLKNGIEISAHSNHKGREYETVTIAAPIVVNGKRGNMAAVVKRTTGNLYKVHRILSPDGSVFLLPETMEEAEPTSGGGVVRKDSLAAPISSASSNTIQNQDGNVKFLEDDEEISQERIDAMGQMMDEKIMADQKAIGRELQARDQRKAQAEARRMEKNRERAQKHKEERKRLLDEARATLAKEPARNTAAPETKLTAQKPIFAKRDVREAIFREFHIQKGERGRAGNVIEGYLDEVLERGYLEDGDLRNLMDRLIDLGVVEFEADEIMAEGRSYLKGNRIYVSESLRREFGDDWHMIQKKAFALGVFLTNDKKFAGVDVWWQDMNGYLPGMFDAEETDQRTMLERLLWIAAEGKAEKMSLSEYTKMLADQEHQSEAELLDSMAQNLGQILRQFGRDAKLEMRMREYTKNAIDQSREKNEAYTKKAVDRQRLYRMADKAHYREHLQNMRNRKELNKLQDRTLKTMQWLNRNRNRAPEELQAQIEEVLGNIDLFAIGAANELNWHPKYQMTWRDIADVYKAAKAKAQKGEIGFIKDPELERIVARLDKDKIADLDISALNDLFNAAVCLRKQIFDADKLLSDENGKRLDGVYTEMVGEMKQAKTIGKGTVWDKFFNTQQLTPMNVLRQMGGWRPDGAWARMAKLLEKGEQDVRAYKVKAARILEDYLNDHADWIHKADGQGKDGIWIRKEVPQLKDIGLDGGATFGDTVEIWMTPMQRVHLYLESKNEDNLRHMVGGRTFVDKELYSKGKRDEAFGAGITVKLAPETVKALVSDLTPEELELAKLLDSYYNGVAHDEINRVSMTLYGFNKAMGKNYAPIFTNQNYTNSEAGVFDQTAEGVGNLKERLHAGNPSRNISALDAFERNVDKTAMFVGMAIPARDWNSLMNWRTQESSMKDQITHHWDEERLKYIDKLLVDLQGGSPTEPDVIQEAADKLLSNYISSIFGFNPSIVLKQAGSLPLAAAYLGGKNMSISMFKGERRDRAFIAKYTQELAWRSMGYAMPETRQLKEKPSKLREGGKKAISAALKPLDLLPKFHTTKESRDQFAEDAFGGGYITKMDEGVASILWAWAENKVQKEYPNLEVGDQKTIDEGRSPFFQKVAEEFNTAVSHSQSVSDVAHQSTMRRSKNVVTRTFTMFRSDSAQTYNALRQMWGEKTYYEQQAKRYAESDSERAKEMRAQAEKAAQAAGKRVGTVVIATACNAILAECINLAMAAIKGKLGQYEDEEEEKLTVLSVLSEMCGGLIESAFGIVTFGDFAAEAIGRLVTGKSGYAEEAPGLEQMMDLVDRIETAAGNARKGDILGAVREIGMAFATYIAGFPAENLEKYLITGIAKHLVPGAVAGYEDALEAPTKADLKGMTGIALEVRLGHVLKEYGVDTDGEMRLELARLYEAGQTDAVPSATPTSVKVDGVEKPLSKQMQKVYDQTRSGILNRELGEVMASPFWEDADDKTKAKMLDKLYDYAAEKAKIAAVSGYAPASSAPAEWDEIAAAGGSIADCAVFKTVTGENGDDPAMKNWEKADLLREWGGTDAVKELMFRHLITDSQEDELAELKKVKVSTDQFLELYAKYGEIDARELTAEQKATEFAYWLDGQRYNDTQKATIKAQMEFRTSLVVEATKYNRAVAAGVDREDALELVEDIKALEPPEGKEDVQMVQKYRVAIDESVSESNQLMRLKAVGMQDATYAKVEAAHELGVAPAAWVRAKELEKTADEDGSGGISQKEWERVIESMSSYGIVLPGDTSRFNLTNDQKAVLWQMLTGSKSSKNNPYSRSAGQRWLDAMGYGKDE